MAAKKTAKRKSSLPEGFVPVTGAVDGWYSVEEGNSIQGTLMDSFVVDGKFGPKRVYKVEITSGTTKCMDSDKNEKELGEGAIVGIDEKGWLKGLASLVKGQEIFVICTGQEEKAKKGQSPAWMFEVGAIPKRKGRAEEGDDDVPF